MLLVICEGGGVEIGKGCVLFEPLTNFIDTTRPYMLTIGEYVKITRGVIILTHDYSLSTVRRVYGEWIGEGISTVIGNNCFIGMNSIILMGSKIGNNVIVGAGSVVSGIIPDNVVIAGNPARVVCTLEEHYIKRKTRTIEEALWCGAHYYKYYGKYPKPVDLAGFKFLFTPRDKKNLLDYGLGSFACSGDDPDEVERAFFASHPYWQNYEEYLKELDIFVKKEGVHYICNV